RGIFTDEVQEFKGHKVFAANSLIVDKIRQEGLLLYESKITHSYPHCWRCKHAIIFRATDQWFLSIDKNNLRQRLIESTKNVEWIPSYGIKRITGMLEMRPDWCLSRQRYWGIPIPVIYCKKCHLGILNSQVIKKFEQFILTEGSDCWYLRPLEDFIDFSEKFNSLPHEASSRSGISCQKDIFCCPQCQTSDITQFEKEVDILDVWFDSGVSFQAVLNSKELSYPADMYLEGSDQHRGWFQTSLIPAVALRNIPPYRTVLTHGFVVDGEGRKMSKSLGNVIVPQEIVSKFGAEILRLWVGTSDYSEDVRISDEIISRLVETYRKIRNTIRFILGNLYDFNPNPPYSYDNLLEIDKWMLHQLQKLIDKVTKSYENYEFHKLIYELNNFCVVDLSGFYLDILKDRLYTFEASSIERCAAQFTLYEILVTLLKMLSPILSFTAEEAWQELKKLDDRSTPLGGYQKLEESVFLENFPTVNSEFLSDELEKHWKKIIEIRNRVNFELEIARRKDIIHSSLEAKVIIQPETQDLSDLLYKYQKDLKTVFIVSQVEILPLGDELKITILHADGKKCLRCWNWSVDTDENELCGRCRKVLVAVSQCH
ncbi:MAG: class I tRNA ligase family protein, partial [Elusimicrobiota bacterium]|nr:class I tRNA ligase family protein [Elusimicrobiota bacterium]